MSSKPQFNYQVELQICTGNEQPIPIPTFPKLPRYSFATMGPEESKAAANKRANELAQLNHGYTFVIRKIGSVLKEDA